MSFWVGDPGALLPLPEWVGSIEISPVESVSFHSGLSGGRWVSVAPAAAPVVRDWAVTVPKCEAGTIAALQMFARTRRAVAWYEPSAAAQNTLTPSATGLRGLGLQTAGRYPLDGGGWAPEVAVNPSAGPVAVGVSPVIPVDYPADHPGMPVTVSAWLATPGPEGAFVRASFLDSAGARLAHVDGDVVAGVDVLRRSTVTVLPGAMPLGARFVQVDVQHATVFGQPQVTWTNGPRGYGEGRGAEACLIHDLRVSPKRAVLREGGLVLDDVAFTVSEVSSS